MPYEPEGDYWVEAIPLPYYLPFGRRGCACCKTFWKKDSYRKHYRKEHTDGKKYIRTPNGIITVKED